MKPSNDLVDIVRRVFVEFLVVTKDDYSDFDLAENGEFVRLLEKAAFALEEGDGPARSVSGGVLLSRRVSETYLFRSSRMGLI